MYVTFIFLCVFNLCFGFAWKGDLISRINSHKHELESNESPYLSSYPYWRRKKVPDNIKHLSYMMNNRKLKRLVYPKRFFQYSPYFIKNKLHEDQKISSPIIKEIINSKKHLESNSINDLKQISDRERMNQALNSNLPPSIPHVSNPDKFSENFGKETLRDNSGLSAMVNENKDSGLLLSLRNKLNEDQFNTDFNNAGQLLNMESAGDKSASHAGFTTGFDQPFSNTGFTNYGSEDSMEHGNYDSWFNNEKSNNHNEETFFSFPEQSNNDGIDTFPMVDKYDGGFGSSHQSLPELPMGFSTNGFTDNGWNDGFDLNTGFQKDPIDISGGSFSPSFSGGHFVSDDVSL